MAVIAAALAAAGGGAGARFPTSARLSPFFFIASFTSLTAAVLLLASAFLSADLSYDYVFWNTDDRYPWHLRLAGMWAGRQGSLMIIAWAVSGAALTRERVWTAAAGRGPGRDTGAERQFIRYIAANRLVLNLLVVTFLMGVVTDSPFSPTADRMLDIHPHGEGMPSALESVYMVVHPPFAFIAYAFCALISSSGLARLASGYAGPDGGWAHARVAWWTMTLGIGLGSVWAYSALGFGGYWAWDPVETANLLPWLVLTALFHFGGGGFLAAEGKRPGVAGAGTVAASPFVSFLAVQAFVTSLVATFVVRSGLWDSVHGYAGPGGSGVFDRLHDALAQSPAAAGVFGLMLVIEAAAAAMLVWRLRRVRAAAVDGDISPTTSSDAKYCGEEREDSATRSWTSHRSLLELAAGLIVAGLAVTAALLFHPEEQPATSYFSRAFIIVIPLLALLSACSFPGTARPGRFVRVVAACAFAGAAAWALFPSGGPWAFASGVASGSLFFIAAGALLYLRRIEPARELYEGPGGTEDRGPRTAVSRRLPGGRRTWRALMHGGIVLVLLGVCVSQGFGEASENRTVGPEGEVEAGEYTVHVDDARLSLAGEPWTMPAAGGPGVEMDRLDAVRVKLSIGGGAGRAAGGHADFRWHEGDNGYLPDPLIVTDGLTDVYVMLVNVTLDDGTTVGHGDGRTEVRTDALIVALTLSVEVKPGVPLLWGGLAVTLAGSGMLLSVRPPPPREAGADEAGRQDPGVSGAGGRRDARTARRRNGRVTVKRRRGTRPRR